MSNEITITESAMKKVLSSDENLRLKVVVETLYEKVKELEEELDDIKKIQKLYGKPLKEK